MSGIEELQQRVIQAEERFGLVNAERAKYSDRLMGLIDTIETRLGDQQAEIERQAGQTASQAEELESLRHEAGENKLLRGMIQSLLNAIELGNDMALSETMQALETKISTLIGDAGSKTAEAASGETETPEIEAAEVPEEKPAAQEPLAEEPEPQAADTPEEVCAAPEPEVIAEANAEAADEGAVAEETPAEPEPVSEPEAETAAPEALDTPAEEAVLETASADAPPAADAIEGDLVDEADAVLEVPAADSGGPSPDASSLEDIMRRVSKLVEDEGAAGGGAEADASEPSPQAQSPEPTEAQNAASV